MYPLFLGDRLLGVGAPSRPPQGEESWYPLTGGHGVGAYSVRKGITIYLQSCYNGVTFSNGSFGGSKRGVIEKLKGSYREVIEKL